MDKVAMYKEEIYKIAAERKNEWKPVMFRNNPEFLEAGGYSIKDTFKKTTLPVLGTTGGGALLGAGIAAKKGAPKGAGAALGALGGSLASIPLGIKQDVTDFKALNKMVANRLGPDATPEEIRRARIKYQLTGIMPTKR